MTGVEYALVDVVSAIGFGIFVGWLLFRSYEKAVCWDCDGSGHLAELSEPLYCPYCREEMEVVRTTQWAEIRDSVAGFLSTGDSS